MSTIRPDLVQFEGPVGFRLAHELEGLLVGFQADGQISPVEADRLQRWLDVNRQFAHLRPFGELAEHVERALADGVLTSDECDDLLFLVQRLTTVNPYFDSCRAGIQVLIGLLAGVSADGVVTEAEARRLSDWMSEWEHICGLWPFTECAAIVNQILLDRVAGDGGAQLLALSQQLPIGQVSEAGEDVPLLIGSICAVDPAIEFRERVFVFTGESSRASRGEMQAEVTSRGGLSHQNVTKKTHFLVVCDEGNPLWAFSCYGRKVEKAYTLRRSGHAVLLVQERDFWDALVA